MGEILQHDNATLYEKEYTSDVGILKRSCSYKRGAAYGRLRQDQNLAVETFSLQLGLLLKRGRNVGIFDAILTSSVMYVKLLSYINSHYSIFIYFPT